MFPSMNNNSYPLFYNQSPSFTNLLETNNISFQHHQELYSNYLMPSNNIPQISENPINTLFLEAPTNLGSTINNPTISSKRAIGKRDRHTKISTAQGVRDRRVRLSINIAREFFNLQDILGFDKASKTLGWLLDKSKDAIKELNSTTIDANEVAKCLLSTSNRNVDEDKDEQKDLSKNATSSSIKRGRREKCNDQSVAKAIRRIKRDKARERARERTKNKKTIFTTQAHLERSRQRDEQNLIFHQSILGSRPTNLIPYGINKGVSVGESIVLKSKSRESCHNYNNYDMITKDYEVGYNNNYHNDHNNFGIIQTPGLSALNIINLSTEIHINGKPWDTYSNQNLH